MNMLLKEAIRVVDMPMFFMVQGKHLAPDVFFSSALSEGPAMFLAQSLSHRLFSSNMLDLSLVCTSKRVSSVEVAPVNVSDKVSSSASENMASSLLITAEAAAQIAEPAIANPGVDYANFILRFRDSVRQNFKNGDTITPDHPLLGKVIEDSLGVIRNIGGPRPAPNGPVR